MRQIIEKTQGHKRLSELFHYGIFGATTTIINIVVYQILICFFDYKISNLIAILASKAFAYITNKLFVFHSHCDSRKELLHEIIRFILARGATGILDYFGLIFAVDALHLDKVWSKYGLQVMVIILNYVLGKRAVFLNAEKNKSGQM